MILFPEDSLSVCLVGFDRPVLSNGYAGYIDKTD